MVQLTEMPAQIAALRRDARGYPVPWFVLWVDGKPQFPVMDRLKWKAAIVDRLCWVCGDKLGAYLAFVAGPMCGINRTSAEPPSHLGCAEFAVANCPFLVNPKMKRIENEVTREGVSPGGVMLRRNPGVSLVWVTKKYSTFSDGFGNILLEMGKPMRIAAYREGRVADSEELRNSIVSGLPALLAIAEPEGQRPELKRAIDSFLTTLAEVSAYRLAPIAL